MDLVRKFPPYTSWAKVRSSLVGRREKWQNFWKNTKILEILLLDVVLWQTFYRCVFVTKKVLPAMPRQFHEKNSLKRFFWYVFNEFSKIGVFGWYSDDVCQCVGWLRSATESSACSNAIWWIFAMFDFYLWTILRGKHCRCRILSKLESACKLWKRDKTADFF